MAKPPITVVYRLDKSPATFDFTNFLALCERYRIEHDHSGLVVAIRDGKREWSQRDRVISDEQVRWRVNNILAGVASLLPSCAGFTACEADAQQSAPYLSSPLATDPILRAPGYLAPLLPFREPYVTLTVRQSWFESGRDTQPDVWNAIIPDLPLPVVVVPDTEAELAGQPCRITAGQLYPAAAMNLQVRMALYEGAKVNLFTSGGSQSLALYSSIPAECYGLHVREFPTCSEKALIQRGLADGRQINNSRVHWGRSADLIRATVRERLA